MSRRTGRSAQKQRTREAILDGARVLMRDGKSVTVTDAADVHGISKATAYRYFSDPAVLIAEAGIAVEVLPYEEIITGTTDLRARLGAITLYFFDFAVEHEPQFRQFLGASLVSWQEGSRSVRRGARRVAMYERAISEAGDPLAPQVAQALIRALTTVTGVEAMIALYDIVEASPDVARGTVAEITEAVLDRYLGPAA